MSNQIPKASFAEIVKHPVTYMLLVAVSLLWFFVYQFTGASGQGLISCEEEKLHLRTELLQTRQEKDDLVQALLVKNGIINAITKNTDSLVRQKVGNEAKSHIK